MASTGKTPNLGLCQWQLSDPFLMEDMNADNAKIDAAVAAVPYVKLMGVTTTADAQTVELDLSTLDLSPYIKLELIAVPLIIGTDVDAQIFVRLNENESCMTRPSFTATTTSWRNYAFSFFATTYPEYFGNMRLELFGRLTPAGSGYNILSGNALSANSCNNSLGFQLEQTYFLSYLKKLSTIRFVPTDTSTKIAAGSKFELYGVRA